MRSGNAVGGVGGSCFVLVKQAEQLANGSRIQKVFDGEDKKWNRSIRLLYQDAPGFGLKIVGEETECTYSFRNGETL
jgi:hypothetical protein